MTAVATGHRRPWQLPSALPPGLYEGIPPEVYHAKELGVVNVTAMSYVEQSPATYRAWLDGLIDDEETKALKMGSALHCAALEPERFARAYAITPEFGDLRTRGPKAARDAWRQQNTGRIELTGDEGVTLAGMVRALREHPKASKLLSGGIAESVIRWDDEELGLPCKARPDKLAFDLDLAIDLKSAADPSEAGFERAMVDLGYDQQQAHYVDGLEAIGRRVEDFLFIVVGKTPPHLVGLYTIDAEDVRQARALNRDLMGILHACLLSGEWPGLPSDIIEVRRPRWKRRVA